MLEMLNQIDEFLFLAMHNLMRGPVASEIWWMVSSRLVWVPMYMALAWWLCGTFGWRKAIVFAAAIGLGLLCADQVCASVIRPMVERLRPTHPDNPLSDFVVTVRGYRGSSFGFPSCHASNTMMLATFTAVCGRRFQRMIIWMFSWAVLNCLSRIYLGVHYPGDLLMGGFIGFIFGIVWARLAELAIRKLRLPGSPLRLPKVLRHIPFLHQRNIVVTIGVITLIVIIVLPLIIYS